MIALSWAGRLVVIVERSMIVSAGINMYVRTIPRAFSLFKRILPLALNFRFYLFFIILYFQDIINGFII